MHALEPFDPSQTVANGDWRELDLPGSGAKLLGLAMSMERMGSLRSLTFPASMIRIVGPFRSTVPEN